MRWDFVVLGGTGLQGKICAKDLIDCGYSVLLCGRDPSHIKDLIKNKKAGFAKVDLRNEKDLLKVIKNSGADVVVNCAELIFNVPIMNACLIAKKSVVDLGGLYEITLEQFKLHDEFKKKGIINLTGCGSTPGIANVMTSYGLRNLDSVESISLGFAWDSNVKKFVLPYSIQSIFDEFTKPPVVLYNGKFHKSDRMKCQGTFDFKEVGRQTVYCIVHSEVYTFYKYFRNKGLKNVHYMAGFPEHSINAIKTLIDLGFNSEEKIDVNGTKVSPIEFTSKVLKKLKIPKGYKEVENLWVKIEGKKNGKVIKKELNCIIKSLDGWEEAGSNVDTGRTISIISQMVKRGDILEKGVYSPEAVVPHEEFFKELRKRKMIIYENEKVVN